MYKALKGKFWALSIWLQILAQKQQTNWTNNVDAVAMLVHSQASLVIFEPDLN